MKTFKVLLLTLTFSFSVLYSNNTIYRWRTLKTPSGNPTQIISGISANNFFVADKFGNLFHYTAGNWTIIKLPNKKFADYKWAEIEPNIFIVACMDINWQTHFFIFNNKHWEKLNYVNPTPIQGIKTIGETVYIYGNFGSFLKYKDRKLEIIKSGIKNHINYFQPLSDNEIYIGVKAEGVFKYDGKNFKHIPFPNNTYNEVRAIYKNSDNQIRIRDLSNRTYKISGDSLRMIATDKDKFRNPKAENFGFRKLTFPQNDSLLSIDFPNSIPLTSFKVFSDTIIVTTLSGEIFTGTVSEINYFTDMAVDYNIPGIANITAIGSAMLYNNNDLLPDLFIQYSSKTYSSRLYENIPNSPFLDISASSNIYKIKRTNKFYFADLDNNYSPDLLTVSTDSIAVWLNIYLNKKGFHRSNRINLTEFIKVRNPRNIRAVDYDNDGDLDIELIYYYGEGEHSGKILFLENKFWGSYFNPDTSFFNISKGWNLSSIFADFNNDELNDLFLITLWRTNKLLINHNTKWENETNTRFSPVPRLDAKAGGAVDYDNDGDLDIFILTNNLRLIIYNNNGNGFFTKSESNIDLDSSKYIRDGKQLLNFGDFNNDGFVDIFISFMESSKSGNIILMNSYGKKFIDKSAKFNIKFPYVLSSSIGDLDNDGDLDIIGTKYGENVIWINNLNDKNYLEFQLKGSKSNSSGLHAKVFIYEEGGLDDSARLVAYQQSGSFDSGINMQNSPLLHFGVNANYKYDVKIKFYGGETKILRSVKTGQLITVNESGPLLTFIRSLPGLFYKTITDRTIHIYAFLILLGFLFLYLETGFAVKYFGWNTIFTAIIITSNISLFYLILFLSASGNSLFVKYILPILVLIVSLLFTNLVFILIKKYQASEKKSEDDYFDELLSQIMQFTHGEWALRNLNSLHLYSSNPIDSYEENYIKQFENRKNTYLNSTAPAISEIIKISDKINRVDKTIENISQSNSFLTNQLTKLPALSQDINPQLITIANELQVLISSISEFKRNLFKQFSCNLEEVCYSVFQTLRPLTDENTITLKIENNLIDKKYALIKSYELTEIIDNSVMNSVFALKSSESKNITIRMYNKVPHICLDIIDNGSGIEKSKWNLIFEKGYSENNGTGLGLHFTKSILSKYGGRIFIKESEVGKGTIFTIEMIEGVNNA